MLNLQALFYPRSIAVIGASTKTGTVGNDILKNLVTHKFGGSIYPINPKAKTLYNLPCFASIEQVPGPVDLAVIVVPAAIVPAILEQSGIKGVKSAIIISAGFKEIGPEGKKLEDQITAIARSYNIALIGPNCLGMINPEINLHACFTSIMPVAGEIAFISQSGALCSSILDYAKGLGIGFSKFISIGNKALIDEVEIIEYLATDPKTKVIMMYEEQLSDAAKFIKTLRAITTRPNGTPVISLKSGRTLGGAAASASHTGALGGDDAMIEAIFRKAGVTRAYSIEELFDYAVTFDHNPLPLGNRVAIVTNAGGPGVIATDSAFENGLRLSSLSDSTKNKLKEHLPVAASVQNPVDVLGDADAARYMHAIDAVMQDPEVDSGIIILTPQSMTEIDQTAREIVRLRHIHNKPLLSCFMGLESVGEGVRTLQEGDVATLAFPEAAARSLAALTHFALRTRMPYSEVIKPAGINKDSAEQHMKRLLATPQRDLNEIQARPILEAYGLSLLRSLPVHTPHEARAATSLFTGKQVVLKIISPDIIHKSDVGGVMININPQDVEAKYEDMIKVVSEKAPGAHLEGMIISEMAPKGGFEFIVGGKRDDALGVATVMVGMGGIYVEVLKDVSFGMVPLTRYGAEKAISRTKAARLLEGVRGQPPLDKEKLIDCLARVSCLLNDFPQIKELDINPLLVYPSGVLVLDARMRIEE